LITISLLQQGRVNLGQGAMMILTALISTRDSRIFMPADNGHTLLVCSPDFTTNKDQREDRIINER
jgi:hypothetical protein